MSGWAPLFPSLTTGTLCGRWPDIGLWPIVLSLKDRNGIVDVTPDYLSRVTGLDLEAVVSCMARFCEPDPYSRSGAEQGRRLVLIDPSRSWGWRVVNSGLYRERARVQAKDQQRTESGEDAERKRKERSRDLAVVPPSSSENERLSLPGSNSAVPPTVEGVPRCPPDSPEVPLSDADAESKARKRAPRNRGCRIPEPFTISEQMRSWAREHTPHVDIDSATEEFVDYWRGATGQVAIKLDWVGTWRNRLRELEKRAGRPNGKPKQVSEWM